MAYEVHLKRNDNSPICLEDWIAAVETTENIRMDDSSTIVVTNPTSGEQIINAQTKGLAQIFDKDNDVWVTVFRWFNGQISTRASGDFDQFDSRQRLVMRDLAVRLNAQVVGDEGEVYE